VGSQFIYNRQSRQSLFLGALTSERWLAVLRLHVDQQRSAVAGYEVDSTGTTELAKENSLKHSAKEDQIELSLPLAPGQTLPSERVMASLSSDYHAQLESYGEVIRALHQPRNRAPTPIGWWSWTAYYFGITEGTALTNAEFLAAQLKDFGYNFFHIDEGYQYARGEYTSPVAYKFPHGVKKLEDQVRGLGLTPGIWTAPFEVAERSSVYANHKDWLVHNAKGEPIHAGLVTQPPDTATDLDPLYVLDTTNPGSQQYLRDTYTTLTRDWGIRYIKLDFMDDTAIEGYYYRPNTTALVAQRIGCRHSRSCGRRRAAGYGRQRDAESGGYCGYGPHFMRYGSFVRRQPNCGSGHCFPLLHEPEFLPCRSRRVYRIAADHCRKPESWGTTATHARGGEGLDCSGGNLRRAV
jgi:hypothetical protein